MTNGRENNPKKQPFFLDAWGMVLRWIQCMHVCIPAVTDDGLRIQIEVEESHNDDDDANNYMQAKMWPLDFYFDLFFT